MPPKLPISYVRPRYIGDKFHCYCSRLEAADQINDRVCVQYYRDSIVSLCLQAFAVFAVIGMNMWITMHINKMAKHYEKHHSMDTEEASVFTRVFLLKFVNTGLLYLIINMEWVQSILNLVNFSDLGMDRDYSVR